jgi:DNA-binding NtrC family response regulator
MAESWQETSTDEVEAARHLLAATSLLAGEDKAPSGEDDTAALKALTAGLDLVLHLFHAERAFLFAARPETRESAEAQIGSCLASWNADGEPVNQPERKVPMDLLARASRTGLPAADEAGAPAAREGTGEHGFHAAAFPVEVESTTRAVVYVENRFQPLDLSRETLRIALGYTRALGCVLEVERLRKENATLWLDVTRLREREVSAAPAASRPRPETRRTKRTDLKGDYSSIIGSSPRMLEIFQILDRIAASSAPVLLNGESGTGKELVAHAVHENSPRKGKVFVSENCGALTETLLESELFGYEKGAFTGANKDHKGLFELAVGGSLFLDEVGDMSPSMQKKLLRVLQEGVIRRVGGKDYIPVDVRIISATNKDLMEEVRAGNFREDLYYRLNVINLKLPPLRERKEDIPELVESFLAEIARETGIEKTIESAAQQKLIAYGWPGNIRELRNEIRRLYALSDAEIRVPDLSETVLTGGTRDFPFHDFERQLSQLTLKEATERLEKEMIRGALIHARGNKSIVAKMLQVPKTSLYNKINKYGFDKL